jgi:hypothetical protein
MAQYRVRETFFRPDEPVVRFPSALPAGLFNGLTRLLGHGDGGPLFLPLRGLQYLAVIEREEVLFVDANGGYGYHNGVGGRLIRIAWRPLPGTRVSLTAPVPCEIVFYFGGLDETQRRLVGEMGAALRTALDRRRAPAPRDGAPRVVALRRP